MSASEGVFWVNDDPLWYKDAIIYEIPVKAYCDGYGDGQGDFRGLTEKLDYIQDLGVTAIWLLPFYPSPLRDDGYDIADYREIHPKYGTMADFEEFLIQAHRRGLRVITELVINHTSDKHPWFQRARRSPPGSSERNFYVWSETPEKFREARIIFKDFETSNWTWDPIAKAYYWHRFYSHQPDLNYDNPAVWEAIFPLIDYWMAKGVDGMRLDAIPYLYEREGTSCENLPETHVFLKALRKHVDARFPNRMFLAEANQWPEDAVAYFGQGDECHTAFHFPVMPRMFMAVRTEDRFPIIDILAQTPPIPDNCQWCLFLRNHDELTLEMVTDEERDYMYRAYASDPQARINLGIRRRLAPLLSNNRRRIELLNGLLFSLPGTPVLYYGDEIGMGDNIYLGDRNGVRTPMQWSGDRNAGFSRANPQKLYLPIITDPEYHYESVNVEAQQNNPNSLLWWMKRLIDLRKRYKAFGRGTLEFLYPDNPKILAFIRRYENEVLLIIANLSRFTQHAALDLSAFAGLVPLELFGRIEFPVIGKEPYSTMLGPHSFTWFSLQPVRPAVLGMTTLPTGSFPELTVRGTPDRLFKGSTRDALEEILPAFLLQRRWFGGKNRQIRKVRVREVIPIGHSGTTTYLTLLDVDYLDTDPEVYLLPLSIATSEAGKKILQELPHSVVACLRGSEETGVVYDGMWDPGFCAALLGALARGEVFSAGDGKLRGVGLVPLTEELGATMVDPTLSKGEQSNSSVLFGDRYILKVFRRLEEGVNPDLEIGRYLTEKRGFRNTPSTVGYLEYRKRRAEPITLAFLQRYIPNEGTGWQFTLDALGQYFERVLTLNGGKSTPPDLAQPLESRAMANIPGEAIDIIGPYLEVARLLGQRTAEMHHALAAETEDEQFLSEPFSPIYQRSIYQSMRNQTIQSFQMLSKKLKSLSEDATVLGRKVLDSQQAVLTRFHRVVSTRLSGHRIRCHGDFHLGQVLYTGKDFIIIDFEGEPLRTLTDRRLKRSGLRDVAGMLRSFHYGAYTALLGQTSDRREGQSHVRSTDFTRLEPWARFWYGWVGTAYLKAYRAGTKDAVFLPGSDAEFRTLLEAFVLSKAVYELGYELSHRPDWLSVPLLGILDLLGTPTPQEM